MPKRRTAWRLEPGQHISFGDRPYPKRCTQVWQGRVLAVTAIMVKVEVADAQPYEVWVLCSHIVSVGKPEQAACAES